MKNKILKYFEKSKENFIKEIVDEARNGDLTALEMLRVEFDTQKRIEKNSIDNKIF